MKKSAPRSQSHFPLTMFTALFLSGFCGLLYEIIFLLVATIIIGASAISTAFVLSLFLLGLALGALLGGKMAQNDLNYPLIFFLSNLFCAALIIIYLHIFQNLYTSLHPLILLPLGTLLILLVPMCQGITIPLAVRILELTGQKHTTGFVYFSNTIGSVLGALISGLLIIPTLGFNGTLIMGIFLNLIVALLIIRLNIPKKSMLPIFISAAIIFILSFNPALRPEPPDLQLLDNLYSKKIGLKKNGSLTPLHSTISPYQHILVARSERFGKTLYLNGELQVTELDSEKYHEYLILPAISAHPNPQKILIAGEGDGGGLYQALKYNFQTIDHVELDPKVISVSQQYLFPIHHGALSHPKINRHIQDAYQFIRQTKPNTYDIIVLAFPDPHALEITSLFSEEFYEAAKKILTPNGIVVLQTGDINAANQPLAYLDAQASILKTVQNIFNHAFLYRIPLRSWGGNCFIIASEQTDPRSVQNPGALSGKWYLKESHEDLFSIHPYVARYMNQHFIRKNTLFNPILHIYMQPSLWQKAPEPASLSNH
jgi:spermidine synthase